MNTSADQGAAFILGMLIGALIGTVLMGLVAAVVTGWVLKQKRDRK